MSADEFVDDIEQALLELVEGNLLRLPGIVIGHENCTQLPEVDAERFSRTGEIEDQERSGGKVDIQRLMDSCSRLRPRQVR
jgi:hypothetical protein